MQRAPWSRLAVWALVLGITSVVGGGFVTGIPAIFAAQRARHELRLTAGSRRALRVARAGGVLGWVGTVASIVVIALWLSQPHLGRPAPPWKAPQPAAHGAPASLHRFYAQKVRWVKCDRDRCAKVRVPVDYERPDGSTLTLAVRVVPADGPGGRSLFVNPGGPGASGQMFAQYLATELPRRLRGMYDIVGVDPRGVGESTPLDCLSDEGMDRYAAADPDPDTAAEVEHFRAISRAMGNGCLRHSGDLARHVSTQEAAQDLDVIRALLGRSKLDYFGASYGTQLGATYATLFPEHSGRLVLDGAVGPSLGSMDASMGQAVGFARALRAYVHHCVADDDCPLGRKVGQAQGRIRALLKQLDAHPMHTAESRRLTEGQAFYGIAYTLYERASWPGLSSALAAALKGDGTVLLRMSDAYFERDSSGQYAGNLGEAFDAISCSDTADRPGVADIEAAMPRFEKASKVFGPMFAWAALRCTDWPIKPLHPEITLDAAGAPPLLVLGTTRDPATPYEWAREMAKALKPAVLVTRVGDGHTAYFSGNRCIQRVVDRYLVAGVIPPPNTVCR